MKYNYYELDTTISEIKKRLDSIDRRKCELDEQKSLHRESWLAIQEKLRIDWTYDSNAIEGSSLTRGETLFFLKEGLTVEGKPFKDFLDAKNHAEAIDWLYETIKDDRPISQSFIKEMNALLLSGITYTPAIDSEGQKVQKKATPGKYKELPNHVLTADGSIHFYVEPILVSDEMEALCQWINENIQKQHPVIVSAIAHYNMVRIHPFDDANGRGARILMNLILIKKKYPITIIKNQDRRKYILALHQADNGDFYPFLTFIANSLIDTTETIMSELKQLEK